jgi:hypothetical protein
MKQRRQFELSEKKYEETLARLKNNHIDEIKDKDSTMSKLEHNFK